MARIKFGGIVSAINGSIGGTTFQKNRYGFTVKQKSNIVKPNSPLQRKRQNQVAEVSREWRNLTNSQRNAWRSYAESYPVPSRLNPNAYLDGYSYFLRYREFNKIANVGGVLANPNGIRNDFTFIGMNAAWTGTTGLVEVALTGLSADSEILIYMSNQLPANINYGKPPLKYIASGLATPNFVKNIQFWYEYVFGIEIYANMIVDMQLKIVNKVAGQVTVSERVRVAFEE